MRLRWWVILLCVLVGAVANVVVAWGVDQFPIGTDVEFRDVNAPVRWPVPVPRAWPSEALGFSSKRLPGRAHDSYGHLHVDGTTFEAEDCGVLVWRTGWPMLSMRRYVYISTDMSAPRGAEPHGHFHAWHLPERLCREEFGAGWLALQPLWPGFAVNTLLYATVIWLTRHRVGALRRWRRLRRGRCVACGYDLTGLGAGAVCPECGGAGVRA